MGRLVGSGRGILWRSGEGEFVRVFSRLCAWDFVAQRLGVCAAQVGVSLFAHLVGSGRGILWRKGEGEFICSYTV